MASPRLYFGSFLTLLCPFQENQHQFEAESGVAGLVCVIQAVRWSWSAVKLESGRPVILLHDCTLKVSIS